MESTHSLHSSAEAGSMSNNGLYRRLAYLVVCTEAWLGRTDSSQIISLARPASRRRKRVWSTRFPKKHRHEHYTGTLAETMAQGGRCERRVAINIESATTLVVLFPRSLQTRRNCTRKCDQPVLGLFGRRDAFRLARPSPASLRDRSNCTLVPEGLPKSVPPERASDTALSDPTNEKHLRCATGSIKHI